MSGRDDLQSWSVEDFRESARRADVTAERRLDDAAVAREHGRTLDAKRLESAAGRCTDLANALWDRANDLEWRRSA